MDFHEPSTHPSELPSDAKLILGYDHARTEYRVLGFISGQGTLDDAIRLSTREEHDGWTVVATNLSTQARKVARIAVQRTMTITLGDA